MFRAQIAGWAAQRWCAANELDCRFELTRFGLSRIEASDILVEAHDGARPLEAGRARLDLRWDGLFKPVVTRVDVDAPILRGRYVPDEHPPVDFAGLERFFSGGGGGAEDQPRIAISNARLEAGTPAGPVIMTGSVSGQLPYQLRVQADIEPTALQDGDSRLVLREGHVDLDYATVRLDGQVSLDVAEAAFDGLSASNARLRLDVSGALNPEIAWTAGVDALAYDSFSVEEGDFSGNFRYRRDAPDDAEGLLANVARLTAQGSIATLVSPQGSTGPASLSLDVSRDGPDALTASFALQGTEAGTQWGAADELTLTSDIQSDNALSSLSAHGDLAIKGASLGQAPRERLRAMLDIASPLDAHADSFTAWLMRAADQFDFGSGYDLRWQGADNWSFVSDGTIKLKTANGSTLTLEPRDMQPAVNVSPEITELTGLLDLSGGAAPRLAAVLNTIRISNEGLSSAALGGVSLEPWTAGGLTISADLNEVLLEASGSAPRLRSVGEISIDGPLYGMTFENTRIFGGADAVFDKSGLRMQTYKTQCLGLDSARVAFTGGVSLGETAFQLCPIDGRIVRRSGGVSSGRFDLGSVSVPFTTQDTSGTLSLEEATLAWQAGQRASISIDATRMTIPMEISDKSLVIASERPKLGLESRQPAEIRADVGQTEFAGNLLPTNVTLASADFDARLAEDGLDGTARASEVRMRDLSQDPLYEPLTGELSAAFTKGVMSLSGPVTTPRAGRTIANVALELDLATLDGNASITMPELVFEPGRLQPTALSERVRGFLSNARGRMQAQAEFDIDGGMPSGRGWVSVQDFGFDTLRLGAVRDVDGRITFDDVIALTTPPGQTVTIGEISPGIPLENGEITFQLKQGREAFIERARWPFSGGELVVAPSSWTISGISETLEVNANQLELSRLIEVFSLPDINAEGTVSGTFPVEIEGPNAYIRGATLTADNEGGVIAYTGKVADTAAQADDRVRMAFNALRDFRFSVLELGADGNLSGDMLITLKLIGTSPEVLDGAPFAFNIGIDSKLMQLIQTGRRATSSEWLADVVAESVSTRNAGTEEGVDESE